MSATASADVTSRARRSLTFARRLALLLIVVLVTGNAGILGLSLWARSTTTVESLDLAGVPNGVAVDARVWRGAAPTADGYGELGDAGVTTIVDLRHDSERGAAVDVLDDLGIELVRIPIRDGQLPTEEQVGRFLEAVAESDGTVFVHCGAGVGRTGAMVAVYQATANEVTGPGVVRDNLAIGPPSLEQIAFAAGGAERPSSVVVGLSRMLDAPRRIWHTFT